MSMTNEELAVKIQQGERDLIPELWEQVERFVKLLADRRLQRLPAGSGLESDDLYDAGYIAFMNAVERFNVERNASFITLLSMMLKTAFAEAGGYRSRRQQKDPLHHAVSLETPLTGEENYFLEDVIPDDRASAAFEDTERQVYLEQLRNELENALSALPDQQSDIIRRRFYNGDTLHAISQDMGTTQERVRQVENQGLRSMRKPKAAKRLYGFLHPDEERRIDQRTNFYYHVGSNRFNSTGTSAVEELALRREKLREREIQRFLDDTCKEFQTMREKIISSNRIL